MSDPLTASNPTSRPSTPEAAGLATQDAAAAAATLLTPEALQRHLSALGAWSIEQGQLSRRFDWADFHHTMAFVNAVAWIAHRADHHPDLEVGYNRCTVRWSTHSAGGLTLKDLICAAQVDRLQCLNKG